jgi:hypothetical protein
MPANLMPLLLLGSVGALVAARLKKKEVAPTSKLFPIHIGFTPGCAGVFFPQGDHGEKYTDYLTDFEVIGLEADDYSDALIMYGAWYGWLAAQSDALRGGSVSFPSATTMTQAEGRDGVAWAETVARDVLEEGRERVLWGSTESLIATAGYEFQHDPLSLAASMISASSYKTAVNPHVVDLAIRTYNYDELLRDVGLDAANAYITSFYSSDELDRLMYELAREPDDMRAFMRIRESGQPPVQFPSCFADIWPWGHTAVEMMEGNPSRRGIREKLGSIEFDRLELAVANPEPYKLVLRIANALDKILQGQNRLLFYDDVVMEETNWWANVGQPMAANLAAAADAGQAPGLTMASKWSLTTLRPADILFIMAARYDPWRAEKWLGFVGQDLSDFRDRTSTSFQEWYDRHYYEIVELMDFETGQVFA